MKTEIKILNEKIEKINEELFSIKRDVANIKNKPVFSIGEQVLYKGELYKIKDIHQSFMNQVHLNKYSLEIEFIEENEIEKLKEI